jgi:hypothetical protein
METVEIKPRGVQRSKEEIISLLDECRKGKFSVKEFVKLKGIHEATYYNWRNKYGSKQGKQRLSTGFATLKINPSPSAHPPALFAEVKEIKIYQLVSAAYLKELLG